MSTRLSATYLATIIERAAQPVPSSGLPVGVQTPLSAHHFNAHHDRAKLLEEVARLQGLIKQAEWKAAPVEDCFEELACPWCAALPSDSPEDEEPRHKPTCPAFGSEA